MEMETEIVDRTGAVFKYRVPIENWENYRLKSVALTVENWEIPS